MKGVPRLPATTARSILKSIQLVTAKKEKGWFTVYSQEIKEMATSNEALIKRDTLNKLKLPTDWEHLNTRIFNAEMGICNKFQLMQTLLNEDSKDKLFEVERLRNGVLDSTSGVLTNLSVIHRVLVGQTVTSPTEKGLLEMWSKGIYDHMRINPMSAKLYQEFVEMYLAKAAILQFKGILLYKEANKNSIYCSHIFEMFANNLKSQIEKMEKTVPSFMKYLTNPDQKMVFTLKPVLDGKDVPLIASKGINKRLGYDYMCGNTEEGKWIFKKSHKFEEDGSLLISGGSKGGHCNYWSVSEKDITQCVSDEHRATPFYVIPLDFTDNVVKIIICKSDHTLENKPFIGNSLKCIGENVNIEFTLSFDCN